MAHVTYEYFAEMYGEDIDTAEFNRLEWEARKIVENNTTGIDGVKKLRVAFPIDTYDADSVKRCVCKLIIAMHQVNEAESVTQLDNGMTAVGALSSITSGSESITFANGSTTIGAATSNFKTREQFYNQIVRDGLAGVCDANGVNLLYMGNYPSA